MNIKYSPQRSDNTISYVFDNDKITVTFGNKSDTFDFGGFTDGVLEGVKTSLPVNPIVSAKQENGILYVELLSFIGSNATHEERFPEWQEV